MTTYFPDKKICMGKYLIPQPNDNYAEFLKSVLPKPKAYSRKYLKLSNYVNGVKLMLNPRWKQEGYTHILPDDHIEIKNHVVTREFSSREKKTSNELPTISP